ncbi:hypothetical protein ZIOFF_074666 [Zingiber officinale]|uniref:Uncharacterized protein n=1 Tax=Zingiber officinale TaxID=94328 RepID=A0A8J5END2_ZINOF|nr:hypothetical protein ZIOFF_074666 [Zingiber officinale]
MIEFDYRSVPPELRVLTLCALIGGSGVSQAGHVMPTINYYSVGFLLHSSMLFSSVGEEVKQRREKRNVLLRCFDKGFLWGFRCFLLRTEELHKLDYSVYLWDAMFSLSLT